MFNVALSLVYPSNGWRTTSEEKRYLEKLAMEDPDHTYENIRRGAEVHRLVRQHARKFIRPGMTMTEIANEIEDTIRALVEENGLDAGIGFPTGLSLNECAAHYTPNGGDTKGESVDLNRDYRDSMISASFEERRCPESRHWRASSRAHS